MQRKMLILDEMCKLKYKLNQLNSPTQARKQARTDEQINEMKWIRDTEIQLE